MRNSILKYVLFLGLGSLIAGCSERIQVYSDVDPDIDVLKFKTYSWSEKNEIESKGNPLLINELTDKRITKAVDQQLQQNGYLPAASEPDLKIHYHVIVKDKTMIRPDDPYTDSYTPYWITGQKDVYVYQEGTLIIDLMVAKTGHLLWRGWAVGPLEEGQTTPPEKNVVRVVNKIFENFPKHPR